MWAGLGYYRRARYLLEGAKYVMEHHDGAFPHTSKELQKIPGGPEWPPTSCSCNHKKASRSAGQLLKILRIDISSQFRTCPTKASFY